MTQEIAINDQFGWYTVRLAATEKQGGNPLLEILAAACREPTEGEGRPRLVVEDIEGNEIARVYGSVLGNAPRAPS